MNSHNLEIRHFSGINIGSFYWCKCGICNHSFHVPTHENSNNDIEISLESIPNLRKEIMFLSFSKLTSFLVGANILIPETVFFENGGIKLYIKYDEKANIVKEAKQIYFSIILNTIMDEMKKRRKYIKQNKGRPLIVAIIRNHMGKEITLSSTQFMALMINRPNDPKFMQISSLQRYIMGVEQRIKCQFLLMNNGKYETDCDSKNPFDINFTNNIKLLFENIIQYLLNEHCMKLIYMKATFVKDEYNKVWLINTEEVRAKISKEDLKTKRLFQKLKNKEEILKKKTIEELDMIANDKEHIKSVYEFSRILNKNYEQARKNSGLISIKDITLDRVNKSHDLKSYHKHYASNKTRISRTLCRSGKQSPKMLLNLGRVKLSNKKLTIKEVLRSSHKMRNPKKSNDYNIM